jgi:peptidoglycan/LPS O-acetylase OafA/YrhL
MNINRKTILPLVVIFILLNSFFLLGKNIFDKWMIDRYALMVANLMFFVISIVTFFMQLNALKNKNPNVFVRSLIGGVMIKMFACIIALLTYYFTSGDAFNKPAVYGGMLIYLIYLVIEVVVMMKLNKRKHA